DPAKSSYIPLGGGGFANTGRLKSTRVTYNHHDGTPHSEEQDFFIKIASADITTIVNAAGVAESIDKAEEMMRGEFAGLNAISDYSPHLCPRALAWGPVDNRKRQWFLATDFLHLEGYSRSEEASLAQRLGELHSKPAPPAPSRRRPASRTATPKGIGIVVNFAQEGPTTHSTSDGERQFGFPVPTYCGDTRQPNEFRRSWADFYGEQRLMMILRESEHRNGKDAVLREAVERTVKEVVPRLLGDGHLGYDKNGNGSGITPVVVHGDLWAGNASWGKILRTGEHSDYGGGDDDDEAGSAAVIYDCSACYAHNEYELGIMKMFGGFGSNFYEPYHKIVPKTEPVEEYADRILLYELYHRLNHHAIFGGGYRSGAMSAMKTLIKKYGGEKQ
ncbi:hypothetical protein KEM54_003970, partial [Ascosphaera aggregata]